MYTNGGRYTVLVEAVNFVSEYKITQIVLRVYEDIQSEYISCEGLPKILFKFLKQKFTKIMINNQHLLYKMLCEIKTIFHKILLLFYHVNLMMCIFSAVGFVLHFSSSHFRRFFGGESFSSSC